MQRLNCGLKSGSGGAHGQCAESDWGGGRREREGEREREGDMMREIYDPLN